MRNLRGYLFLLLTLSCFGVAGQIRTSFQVETGVNISSLPIIKRKTEYKESWIPVVSPLIGIWITAGASQRFNLSLGTQYYSQGQQYRRTSERYDLIQESRYQSKSVEKMEFRQVSAVIMANYYFPLRSGALGVSIGYRVGSYIAGHYSDTHEVLYDKDAVPDFYSEKNVDPFGDDLFMSAKRTQSQICLAVQYSFNAKWTAVTSYAVGTGLSFTEPFYGWCATGFVHSYNRGDIGMTVKYRM
jgi:hypothetical protein